MNADLIKTVGEYKLENILDAVDRNYMQYAAKKEVYDDGTICYWGHGNKHDFGNMGSICRSLKTADWFIKYVERWYWYNNSSMPYKDWFRQEDILKEWKLGESV